MFMKFLSNANYLAILVAAIAFFVLGSLWFSFLFRKPWAAEVEKSGVKLTDADKKNIGRNMILTFLYNLIAAISIAYIIYAIGVYRWMVGLKLGLICGLGFSLAATGISSAWEKRSTKLMLLDAGYALVGIAICGAIIAAWH
jgi:uncharacterized membrane protein YkgB